LGEGQKYMFVGQKGVLTPASLLDRSIYDSLRAFSDLAWRDVEVFYVHQLPPSL
jgi:hypothetical protein